MTDLATADDVAQALGLADSSELSAAQGLRVDALLARVSREFRREAERNFTPGTTTVRLLTVGGRVRLAETVATVTSVTTDDAYGDAQDVDYEIDGQELVLEQYGRALTSGIPVTVTYTHTAAVPDEVAASVAAIVARHLIVAPTEVEVSMESAGPFARNYADWWVRRRAELFTEDERNQARSYRYPGTAVIIQRP